MSHNAIQRDSRERYAAGRMRQHSTRAMFFIGGFGAASWAPLVPLLRQRLDVGENVLGMLLLCIGMGSLITMPISGSLSVRLGCRKVLTVASLLFVTFLLALCHATSIAVAVVSLLGFGAAMGAIDVTANIQAVIVEKAARRQLMSGMHALWSVGGFAGAGLFGVWVGGLGFTPAASTGVASAIMLLVLAIFSRHLLPFGGDGGGTWLAMPRGVVAYVGIVACISFLLEGAIMDWSGVFLITVRHFDISKAGAGFTVFSAAMLVMRLLGDWTVQRLGQKAVVLGGSLMALVGFLLVVFAEKELSLYVGFFAIGIGIANIVPVFFSLIGKQKDMPISNAVSAVSTMGYLGILMGPAAIGALAHIVGLCAAFGFLAALVALQAVVAAYVYKRVLQA